MTALLDTGFLLAVLDASDNAHKPCVEALIHEPSPILPDVVVPELAYLVLRELGYPVLIKFLNSLTAGELVLERATLDDFRRTSEILTKYADSHIDFVDGVIAAIAERMDIQRILTVDRRHFGLFRPQHCDFFTIVPD